MRSSGLNLPGLPEASAREWRSIELERDPEFRLRELLVFGRSLLQRRQIEAAIQVFHHLQNQAGDRWPGIAAEAGREIAVLSGKANFGASLESFAGNLVRESTSVPALIGMAGAQAAYGLARFAIFTKLGAYSGRVAGAWGARIAASLGASAVEATSFTLLNRGAQAMLGEAQDWWLDRLARDSLGAFLTLGGLRFANAAGTSLARRIETITPTLARRAFVEASTLSGLFLGKLLETEFGLSHGAAPNFAEGIATLLQFKVSGRILSVLGGRSWNAFIQELDSTGRSTPQGPILEIGRGFAFAGARPPQTNKLRWVQSFSIGDQGGGSGAPIAKRPVEILESALGWLNRDQKFEPMPPGQLYGQLIQRMLERGSAALSAKERQLLRDVANLLLDEPALSHLVLTANHVFRELQDFSGLRRVANLLPDESMYKFQNLLLLEDYPAAFRCFDASARRYRNVPFNDGIFSLLPDAYLRLSAFVRNRGYQALRGDSFDRTALQLTTLADSYDLIVAIAKGGLGSGAVADFLGLPVRVIEVHAHDRAKPTSKFVDAIAPEEIAGRRVLLVDEDMVTGASIREAVNLIELFRPAAIGAYFQFDLSGEMPRKSADHLREAGIKLHFPEDVPAAPSLPYFFRLHETLRTPLGRFRLAGQKLAEFVETEIDAYLARAMKIFFSFNPMLAGAEAVRGLMASRLEALLKMYRTSQELGEAGARNHLLELVRRDFPLPASYAAELANARYYPWAMERSRAHGVENPHLPHSYLGAFRGAQRALLESYDVALIVGPEGFAYEPIFLDLGLPTLAVHIPESDPYGERSFVAFDRLAPLQGRRVLVVEDDIRSGATLRKLVDQLNPYRPSQLGLYLGLPAIRQSIGNIPSEFGKIHLTEPEAASDEAAFLNHLKSRTAVFKDTP